ncbi:hypothetical protein ACFSGX_05405 [Sphingomonas arantia]|uniref:Lipoprotein n=1 Tax=Sphingomonas arantia TaxID=1460676 RepID=A0ABW4TYW5_9SPHN
MTGTGGMKASGAVMAVLLLAACGGGGNGNTPVVANETVAETAATNAVAAAPVTETAVSFVGTWTGPEGLSFEVEPVASGGFRVRNQDTLDEKTMFDARQEGGTLRFVRRGQALVARPGTGAETGFKWLANKRDCLIVQAGVEGYCRD